jgi:hypothetical protein
MKNILDIRHIVIAILLIVAIVEFVNPKGIMPHRTFIIHDTVEYEVPVHDTLEVEVPIEVEVPVEVQVPYVVHDTIPIVNPIDTNAILNSIGMKMFKKDILKLPNNVGTVTIFDTISNGRVLGRSFKSDIKQKVVRDTTFLGDSRKNLYYFGIDAKLDKPNVINLIGVGFIIKDKDAKHLYKIGVGVSNQTGPDRVNGTLTPFLGGGVYWRVNFKKK